MTKFYCQGERDGFKFYAPDHRVFGPGGRTIRNMTATEAAEYDAGYKVGKGRVDGRRLAALGYDRD